jgi:hypothetical protein
MGTDDGAIDNQVLHLWIVGEVLMHSFPKALLTPTGKALVDGVPVAVGFRQQAPLGAAAGHPEDGFDEASALGLVANVDVWTGAQELEYFRPLVVA